VPPYQRGEGGLVPPIEEALQQLFVLPPAGRAGGGEVTDEPE
jgi:hypothetical protein